MSSSEFLLLNKKNHNASYKGYENTNLVIIHDYFSFDSDSETSSEIKAFLGRESQRLSRRKPKDEYDETKLL